MDLKTLNKDLVLDKQDIIQLIEYGTITMSGILDEQGNPKLTKLSELINIGAYTHTYEMACELLNKKCSDLPQEEVTEIISTEEEEETIPLPQEEDVEETDKITPVVVEENELEDLPNDTEE